MSTEWNSAIFDVSIRLGKGLGTWRLIMMIDLSMAMAMDIIPNMDADELHQLLLIVCQMIRLGAGQIRLTSN